VRPRKTLSSWLTNKYILIIRNEENFAEKTSFTFNYARVFLLAFLMATLVFIAALFSIKTILAQWFDPKTAMMEERMKLVKFATQVDSLEQKVNQQEAFIANFQRIVRGEEPGGTEMSGTVDSATIAENVALSEEEVAPIDSIFRTQYENTEVAASILTAQETSKLQELYFYTPVKGYISAHYDIGIEHFGVDIVADENEPVKCIADGTVIFSSWTQDSGYVLAVQHNSNMVSLYKHNSALLKKLGNFVNAGEVISIIGNTGELTTGPHLHFELWFNGYPVNPEEFVTF